jgi:hypothetical protein
MTMFRNKQKQTELVQEGAAKAIALKIIQWQRAVAALLNKPANRLSKPQQMWALLFLCFLAATGLTWRLVQPFGSLAVSEPNSSYQPVHIGLPSRPFKPNPTQRTDSLTIKK